MTSSGILPRLIVARTGRPALGAGGPCQVWHDAEGRVFASCRRRGARYELDLIGLARFQFDTGATAVTAIPHRALSRATLAIAYGHYALPFILPALGTEVLHSSAVRVPGGIVAFCGGSGSGKSTLAFGLSRRAYALWADDAVALEVSRIGARGIPLPYDVRLRPASTAFFGLDAAPGPGRPAWRTGDGPRAGRTRPAVRAVCVLKPGPRNELRRLSPASALVALLPHAFCFTLADRRAKRRMVRRYLALAARVPIFELQFDRRWEVLPALLDRIERDVIQWHARAS